MHATPYEILFTLAVAASVAGIFYVYVYKQYYITQYLYYLRYPLLFAFILLFLPLAAGKGAPNIIKNLFVLDAIKFGIITPLTLMLCWAIMFTSFIIFEGASKRFKLPFRKHDPTDRANHIPDLLKKYGFIFSSLLAIPLLLACYLKSIESFIPAANDDTGIFDLIGSCVSDGACLNEGIILNAVAIFIGIIFSLGLRQWAGKIIRPIVIFFSNKLCVPLLRFINRKLPMVVETYNDLTQDITDAYSEETIFRAISYLVISLIVYVTGGFVLNPDNGPYTAGFPVMGYIIILMLIFTWIFSLLSTVFDKYRIPVILVLISIFIISYIISDTDHYYPILTENDSKKVTAESDQPGGYDPREFSIPEAIEQWARYQDDNDNRTMILVAASGGGITASYWTNVILSNLVDIYGEKLAKSIFLISGASGGGVGAMYFSDQYQNDHTITDDGLKKAINNSAASSLSAVGWGLTYPDLKRMTINLAGTDDFIDRGWAIEKRWESLLKNKEATLHDVKNAYGTHRPYIIFNATITETGDRLQISPFLSDNVYYPYCEQKVKSNNFLSMYPESNLKIVTAARLSATFPYVSPIARPKSKSETDSQICAYHLADGGYVDNYGIMALAKVINEIIDDEQILKNIRKIIILEIRASDTDNRKSPNEDAGWLYTILGPIITLLEVRTTSQVERNNYIVDELKKKNDINTVITNAIFELDNDAPLSWHLSRKEQLQICNEWDNSRNKQELMQLDRALGDDFNQNMSQNSAKSLCHEVIEGL